ncbi:hypothetical protein L6452_05728 [Arctium lappa]|uniref:Uncharacterized protein n=1 Tax=Arctium lappa TaxID=4217 RepID=A0ACB9EH87_ARCLA|nr:hypothetical protein L6452_05728 [Arctium lappa]
MAEKKDEDGLSYLAKKSMVALKVRSTLSLFGCLVSGESIIGEFKFGVSDLRCISVAKVVCGGEERCSRRCKGIWIRDSTTASRVCSEVSDGGVWMACINRAGSVRHEEVAECEGFGYEEPINLWEERVLGDEGVGLEEPGIFMFLPSRRV